MWRLIQMGETQKTSTPSPETQKNVGFNWGVKIPLRNGIVLNATLYKPKTSKPVPAIFTLTPYIADSYHARAAYFAQHGYAYALVDCRGRGNSQGQFEPFVHEAQDGYDAIEWLAGQPWCDGQVAMWGGSYAGFDQWMALKEFPPHLKTIVPAAAAHAGIDFPFFKNIFTSYEMQWMTFTSGVTGNSSLFGDFQFWIQKFQEMYQSHHPYNTLDQIVGNESTIFQTWIKHPHPDAYWDQMALSNGQYDRISLPILTITGHYDADQPGAMEYYRRHMQSNSNAKDQHYLVIGPWDHPGTRSPKAEFDGLKFSEASVIDLNQLHQEWYDWIMKTGKKPSFLKKRVAYYVAGEEKWKYADWLESIARKTQKLYLNSNGSANDVFHSGTLDEKPAHASPPDTFTYDPLDKRPGELEREEIKEFLTDQTYDLNLFGNGLVYHSTAFSKDTEITGWVKMVAWMSLNVPDTDFCVTLSEVLPDGKVIKLSQDLLRARYRQSLREEKWVETGEINPYTFEGFTFFARRIAKGSRLRLLLVCPNTINLEKNYNSGGVVAEETGVDAHIAQITLYHDADHPSYLEIPIAG
jgi:putative CocE/NonD family hydrolase